MFGQRGGDRTVRADAGDERARFGDQRRNGPAGIEADVLFVDRDRLAAGAVDQIGTALALHRDELVVDLGGVELHDDAPGHCVGEHGQALWLEHQPSGAGEVGDELLRQTLLAADHDDGTDGHDHRQHQGRRSSGDPGAGCPQHAVTPSHQCPLSSLDAKFPG